MFSRHKWPSFSGILMIADFAQLGKILYFPVLIVIIPVFSFLQSLIGGLEKALLFQKAFLTADNKLISAGNLVTGNMVKVTGMVGRW
ncbi:MAG: hypothetical protein KKC75_06660 [Nanoarchaeota archaeon]|nr:hypothetical protein [Nanoarchaeota archaeon]MBU1945737.1 hypothetical protein [Nanoarchaeota archaeon]